MFKLIKKDENITAFYLFNNKYVYKLPNGIFHQNKIVRPRDYQYFTNINNNLLLQNTEEDKGEIYEWDTATLYSFDFLIAMLYTQSMDDKEGVLFYDLEYGPEPWQWKSWKSAFFNLRTKEIIKEIPVENLYWNITHYRTEKYLYLYGVTGSYIHVFSTVDYSFIGTILDVSTYQFIDNNKQIQTGRIFKILGDYEGVLYVSLYSGMVLGICMDSHEIKHEILFPHAGADDWIQGLPKNQYMGWGTSFQLDKKRGIIFMIKSQNYGEINLKTPQPFFQYKTLRSIPYALGPQVQFPFTDQYIFYGSPNGMIVAFNRDTHEIDWQEQIISEETNRGLRVHQTAYQNGKLYVRTQDKVLRIYERNDIDTPKETT